MNIAGVHTALASILAALTITSPVTEAVTKVWPYTPPVGTSMQPMSWIIFHDLTGVRFLPGGMVEQKYDMHAQFFGRPTESQLPIGAEIANAFLDKLVTSLSDNQKLGGTSISLIRDLRGASAAGGTLAVLEWAGQGYVGLDLIIPVTLTDVRARGV